MTDAPRPPGRRGLPRFLRDERGVSAVEFAIVCGPFLAVVIYILQLSVYYLTQSALDAGVIRSADALRNGFSYATTPAMPSGADLKAFVARNSGAVIANDATLAVEIRPLGGLASALVSITDGTAQYGATETVLVLRATSRVVSFAPGFSSLASVTSSSIIRRGAY